MVFYTIVILLFLCGSIEASASETKSFEGCTVHLFPPSHYTANSSICDGITWAKGRPDNDFLVYNMQSGRLFHYVNDSFEHGKYDVLNTSNWDLAIHNPQKEDSNVYYFKHSDKVFPMNLQVEELHLGDLQQATSVVLDGMRVNSTATKLVLLNSSLNFTIKLSDIKGIDRPVVRITKNFKGANLTDEMESQSIMSGSFLQVMVDTSHPGEYVYTIQASLCDKMADPITIKVVVLDIKTPEEICHFTEHEETKEEGWLIVGDKTISLTRKFILHSEGYKILPMIKARVDCKDIPVHCGEGNDCELTVKKDFFSKDKQIIITTSVEGLEANCNTYIQLRASGISGQGWGIIGGIIGGVLVILGIIAAVLIIRWCRKRKRQN